MNVTNLRSFWAVARTGSFTRAAAEIGVSQPTITRQVKAIEERYNTVLLVRDHKGCHTTPAGERLLAHVNEIFSALDRAERELSRDPIGTIRFMSVRHTLMIDVLALLSRTMPSVTMKVTVEPSVVSQAALENGDCDLALLALTEPIVRDLQQIYVARRPLMVFVPPDHPLEDQSLSIEAILDFPLTTGTLQGQARLRLEQIAAELGGEVKVRQEIGPIEAIKAYALKTGILGVFSDDGYAETVCAHTRIIEDARAQVPVCLAASSDLLRNPALSTAWGLLTRQFGIALTAR